MIISAPGVVGRQSFPTVTFNIHHFVLPYVRNMIYGSMKTERCAGAGGVIFFGSSHAFSHGVDGQS
jgi:hypothetical protein